MKPSLLISTAVAIVIAAVAAASSAAGSSGKQILPGFRTPSGNIGCYVAGKLYCEIRHADYAARLQARCDLDWHGFKLGAKTKAASFCSGDQPYNPNTQRPSHRTLPYGETFHHGAFTCTSRVTGVTCRGRTGHGLFISRQAYRTW
jgi:hypothetical protein